MKNIFSGFRGGIVWVILAVLVVAVSLTAQAPKAPASNQSVSEVGRYVFWSTTIDKDHHKYGFLDTKRGRIWIFRTEFVKEEWFYHDLNDLAIDLFRTNMLTMSGLKDTTQQIPDTSWYWRKIESAIADFEKGIRQKEK